MIFPFALVSVPKRTWLAFVIVSLLCVLCMSEARAAISYTTPGSTYSEDFDSLPTTPTNTNIQTSAFTNGWQDDTTTVAGDHVSVPGWYLYHETAQTEGGTNGNQRLRIGTGSSGTGSFWDFGVAGVNAVTDRALGSIGSTTIDDTWYALRLTNNTGLTLGQFTLDYTAEQWRDGGTSGTGSVAQDVTFGYAVTSTSPTDISALSVTQVAALGFTSPTFGATAGTTLDGNDAANRVVLSPTTIQGINWAPGEDLWLRWYDPDHSGNDHGLAIDDLTFSANVIPTSTWTGTASTDWNSTSNWDTGIVPGSGSIANFDNAGNGNTTISLGGTRPINIIQFNSAAAAYTLGSSSEQFDVDNGGAIKVASDVITPQTINAKINALGDLSLVNNSTDANAGLTIGSAVTMANNSNLAVDGAGTVTFNAPISGTGSTLTTTSTGTIVMNAQHTYTGGTNVNATVQNVIRVGVSTVGNPGSVTSGPFGTSTVNISGSLPPILQPAGDDITIANDITLSAGLFTATAPASVDPTVRSLTLTGPITTVGGARVITNNILAGGTLTLGSASSPSTITLVNNLALQSQTSASGGGIIIVNDSISGPGGINAQNGATVYITNNNTNSLESNVQNSASGQPDTTTMIVNNVPVNVGVDAGLAGGVAIRTGTLAGTGTIAGDSRLLTSANGNSHLAPGNGASFANGPGKLTFYNNLDFSGSSNCSGCNFDAEIGGLTAGTEYDQVVVGGTLTIGDTGGTPRGTLNVTLINGFTRPASDASFEIMQAGTRDGGEFATVNVPDPSVWSVRYTSTSVFVDVLGSGDFNHDSIVDAADYVVWRKTDGGPGGYDAWRQNFGSVVPGSGSALGAAAVPEPATLVLSCLMFVFLAARGRYAKRQSTT